MSDVIRTFAERGDLAHLALLLWALSASALTWFALRELTAASRRLTTSCASSRASTNYSEATDGNNRFRRATEPVRDSEPV